MPAEVRLSIATRAIALIVATVLSVLPTSAGNVRYGFGRTPTAAEISAWNGDIRADGQGLPRGQGSAAEGAKIFSDKCAACHGNKGERSAAPIGPLVGGKGTLTSAKPVKTIGSYWPSATTLFDFIHRAMPFDAPESLSDNEVYALTAYLLSLNGIMPSDAVLNAKSLPKVNMPNRNGFIVHDWRGTKAVE